MEFGRYRLVERLAIGGMAELFKAEVSGAHGFTKQVVIKRILPHLAGDEHFTAMFIDEAKITARLSHPKIAQTLELGKFDGQLYIAMEYIDGLDVLAMLRESAHRRQKLPLPISVHIVMEVLDALDFAHQQTDAEGKPLNIVHRDISPSNILVSRRGDVKLVDFGIAQAAERDQHTRAGTLKGKYGYMAPEQVVGQPLDARSDLFSCGIVLAEMAMGRRLFISPNELDVLLMVRDVKLHRLDKYGANLDPELLAIIRKALAKAPDDRYQSGGEFRDALGEWMFERRHRVTPKDVAALVDDLYDAAWARKRASRSPELDAPPQAAAPAHRRRVANATEPAPPPGAAAPAGDDRGEREQFPASASMEEAIALVAGELDGIPLGEQRGLESQPVVLIEQEPAADGSPPAGSRTPPERARRDTQAGEAGARAETDDGIVIDEVNVDSADYQLGDLARELARADDDEPSARAPTTQEIAFDDIVEAVENALPRDAAGRVIEPSEDEIEQARARRPALVVESVAAEPDDRGDLAQVPPIRVLCRLAVARATGLLVVSIGSIKKEIFLVGGQPEYVASNLASELFGEYLVAHKVISEGELSMALAMMPHYGGKLGDTLVGLGLMKPLDVFRQLTQQVRGKVIDVCTWAKGEFSWYDGVRNERDAFPLDLDPFEVLGAGAMAVQFERIEAWIDAHRDERFVAARKPAFSPEQLRLGAAPRDVFNQLDGSRSVGELVDRYDDVEQRTRFMRVLYLLVMTELARPA